MPLNPRDRITKLVGVGGSTMAGHGARRYGQGWFDKLGARFYDTFKTPVAGYSSGVDIMQLAQAGETVSSFDKHLGTLIQLYNEAPDRGRSLWLVQSGNNEAWVRSYDRHMPIGEYAEHVGSIALQLLEAGAVVVGVGTVPIAEKRVARTRSVEVPEQVISAIQYQDVAATAIKKAAIQADKYDDAYFVPLYATCMMGMRDGKYDQDDDGIHPNPAGHDLIADRVWQEVAPITYLSQGEDNIRDWADGSYRVQDVLPDGPQSYNFLSWRYIVPPPARSVTIQL